MVRPGHGERQRHRGEGGDLPVEGTRQEELVEDHHGDGLAEDHADSHHLQRGKSYRQHVEFLATWGQKGEFKNTKSNFSRCVFFCTKMAH